MHATPIRAVLLDLDDTLTDRIGTVRAYAPQFLRDFGARFRMTDETALAAELARIDRNGYNHERAIDIAAHEAWSERPDAEVIAQHWNHYFAVHTQARPALSSTLDAIARAGLQLGVVTNGPTDKQRRKVEALGLRERLGAVLISAELGIAKPDERIFRAAAQQLGVQPSECMFVGDNPEKDVGGATAVGMRAVWFRATLPWPEGLPAPHESVASLGELLGLLGLPRG
jgi:putative hydrolase of the HAD superfamily